MSFQILQEEDLLQIVKESLDSREKKVVEKIVGKRLEDVKKRLKGIRHWPSTQRQVSGRDPATGQVTGDTEIPDSDRELFEDIDRFCRQFADSDSWPNAPERSAAYDGFSVGSEIAPEDTHGDVVDLSLSEDEPWFEVEENKFFNAPSTVPGSSNLTDPGPSTSGLSRETASWLRATMPASRDGANSSQRRSSTQPSTGPSPCKRHRRF